MESEAILTILKRGQMGIYRIVGSDVLEIEMERMQDEVKKQWVKDLYKVSEMRMLYSEEIKKRSQEIMEHSNIKTFDSIHIAMAESAHANVMLTTDDKLEKMAKRLELDVKVMNPLRFVWEVI